MRPAIFLSLLLALPALGQTVVESIDVRVVSVDVVVTDKSGKRVTGLTANDFEVFEDGKKQTITNFSEIRGTAVAPAAAGAPGPAAEVRPRRFLLFVDNYSLHPDVRSEVVASLETFIAQNLRPADEASVVSWNRKLNILVPFTRDRAALVEGIKTVGTIGSPRSVSTPLVYVQVHCQRNLDMARSGRMRMNVAYEDCILAAREKTEEVTLVSRQLLGALNVALATMSGFEGRKVLVLAGAQLPSRPGVEMFLWANNLFQPYMRGTFDAAIARPDEDSRTAQTAAVDKLAESANAHGVTLYLIAAGLPGDAASVRTESAIDDQGADFLHRANTASAYQKLADATGGLAVTRNAKLATVLDSIATDVDSYYSLGYRPGGAAGGRERALVVKTKNPALTVRARKGWTPKSEDDQFGDRVVANIYSPTSPSEFEVRLRADKPQKKGDTYVIPIEVTFAPTALTLLPRGNELAGGFTISVAVGNPLGGLSTVFRQPQPITIRADEESGFRQTPITWTATLSVRKGENLISVGVLDQVSRETGFARTSVTAE